MADSNTKPATVDDYVSRVPDAARAMFDQLRQIVVAELPHMQEVISYGIIGFRSGKSRPKVFISGWNDHVAIYPVPPSPDIAEQITPYKKGKGTLWFGLREPPPEPLIRQIVRALASGEYHELTDELRAALEAAEMVEYWESLTDIQRNEWVCWTTMAKQQTTRETWLRRAIEEMREGRKTPCCWPGCPHRRPNAAKWFEPKLKNMC